MEQAQLKLLVRLRTHLRECCKIKRKTCLLAPLNLFCNIFGIHLSYSTLTNIFTMLNFSSTHLQINLRHIHRYRSMESPYTIRSTGHILKHRQPSFKSLRFIDRGNIQNSKKIHFLNRFSVNIIYLF